jgi:hypothetical protein
MQEKKMYFYCDLMNMGIIFMSLFLFEIETVVECLSVIYRLEIKE